MKFQLVISLGNESMQTQDDIASALREVVTRLDNEPEFGVGSCGYIYDANGNNVGKWSVHS